MRAPLTLLAVALCTALALLLYAPGAPLMRAGIAATDGSVPSAPKADQLAPVGSEAASRSAPRERGTRTASRQESEIPSPAPTPRRPGHVHGRVLDADGVPVEQGHVQLRDLDALGEPAAFLASAETTRDGDYALRFERGGTFSLRAWTRGVGSVEVAHAFAAGSDVELDLRYPPAPVLEARVVDAAGVGVPGVDVRASRVTLAREDALGSGPSVRSDDAGAVRFVDLTPGDYHLYDLRSEQQAPLRLTEDPVPHGARGVELRWQGRRATLRVLDERGAPLDSLVPFVLPVERLRGSALFVAALGADGRAQPESLRSPPRRRALEGGAIELDLREGAIYAVGVVSADRELAEAAWRPSGDAAPGELVLRLSAPQEGSCLRFELLGPDGAPWHRGARVLVSTAASDVPLRELRTVTGAGAFRLGAGSYRVRAITEPARVTRGGPSSDVPCTPAERVVEVTAGRETLVELSLGASGRLALTLEDELDSEVRPPPTGESPAESLRRLARGARVHLLAAEGGTRLDPEFEFRAPRSSTVLLQAPRGDAQVSVEPWIPLGVTGTSVTPLAPGDYELVVELEGLRTRRVPVTIRLNATTERTLHLSSADRAP